MKKVNWFYPIIVLTLSIAACHSPSAPRTIAKPNTSNSSETRVKKSRSNLGDVPANITRSIIEDQRGDIWIATFGGLIKYDREKFILMSDDVTDSRFFSALEDNEGNLWFGTIGEGIFRYSNERFENYTTEDGLLNNEIVCIYEDSSSNIWFGLNGGVVRYDGQEFKKYILDQGQLAISTKDTIVTNFHRPPNGVNSITQDQNGQFWFGTNSGVFTYSGEKFTPVQMNGKFFSNVRTIICDQTGHIWIGGNHGISRYDGHTFETLSEDFTGYIYEDRKGNIWTSSHVASSWALSKYDQDQLTSPSPTPSIIKANEGMFFGILEDREGSIWSGKLDGVYRYDHNKFEDFKNEELPGN